ncbi:nitrite reductase small subunit NirD [Parahaliea maris]|uniref:Nitrite reductase small subunit NirD n=1 Tax=Parahaliea maris TaxID=2716870 RepID=A0A5C9A6R7_9GAMM|nr:nitrite reductase small subunit NirD [Parahaliea maris]TXS95420.1 nitrite reductase small subunit NirD [Parahaliea maris]
MEAVKQDDWQTVCTRDDLVLNSGVCALVGGEQVAIFYLPDTDRQVFALGNRDPIGKANVMSRGIVGDLQGQVVVASPLYKQHFNLETGACLEEEGVFLPVYDIQLDGDAVNVKVAG